MKIYFAGSIRAGRDDVAKRDHAVSIKDPGAGRARFGREDQACGGWRSPRSIIEAPMPQTGSPQLRMNAILPGPEIGSRAPRRPSPVPIIPRNDPYS